MEKVKNKFLRIGVLTGGCGIEREVSFNSGRTICDHLDSFIYEVIPLFQASPTEIYILPWHFLHRGKISDFEHRLKREAKLIAWDDLKTLVDFVYIAMHGRYAEDGTMQGMLELFDIPYLGSNILASAMSMDKDVQRRVLENYGIKIPTGFTLFPLELEDNQFSLDFVLKKIKEKKLKFPLVVKPAGEGSSLGVSIAENEPDLIAAVKDAMYCDSSIIQPVIVENKIEGMEFTAIYLQKKISQINICAKGSDLGAVLQHSNYFSNYETDKTEWIALPLTEIVIEKNTKFYDYSQKYMPGRASKITPARCRQEDANKINNVCLAILEIFEMTTFARIDGFLTANGDVIIIDINPLSGMTPTSFIFHQAAEIGMSHTQLINYLIEVELEQNYSNRDIFNFNVLEPKNSEKFMEEKIKIAVLLGGDSNEKEISLESGRNVCYKLSPKKYEVIPIFVDEHMQLFKISQRHLIQNSTKDIKLLLNDELKIKWSDLASICDFVFIALHGGKGENGTVQGALEMLNIPYNGSGVFASALCMDKFKTNDFLKSAGFDVPNSLLIKKHDWISSNKDEFLNKILEDFDFPLIVKPHNDGCSVGVSKVNDKTILKLVIDNFFEAYKEFLMIEEFIAGVELTCGVIGNEKATALPPSMPVIQRDVLSIEEKFLPGAGENQTPADLPENILNLVKSTMEKIYTTIGCKGYVRIDCFYQPALQSRSGKDKIIILEINSLPGLTPATCIFHQAAEIGLKPMDFIDKIVELGFELHNAKFNIRNSSKQLMI